MGRKLDWMKILDRRIDSVHWRASERCAKPVSGCENLYFTRMYIPGCKTNGK